MLLIDLPLELLQVILRHSSTPSFMQLIRTSHTFFDLAAQSRDIVKCHLNDVPGDKQILSDDRLTTEQLFLTLRRRAAAALQGVNISADRREFYSKTASIDVHASCITSTGNTNVALVRKDRSSVQLYEPSQGNLKLTGLVIPEMEKEANHQPLHTAFDQMNNFYVLYRVEIAGPDHPWIEPSTETMTAIVSLIRVRLSVLSGSHDSWKLHESSVTKSRSMGPVSMAVYGGDKVSIAWNTNIYVNHAKHRRIALYTLYQGDGKSHAVFINDLPNATRLSGNNSIDPPEHCNYPTSRIMFSSGARSLKSYSTASAAPSCRIQSFRRRSTSNVTVNKIGIDLDDDTTEWFFVEDPFFGHHETLRGPKPRNELSCRNVRLSLATATFAPGSQPTACILRSTKIMPEDDCTHTIDLNEAHAIASGPIIRVVARLWGFKLPTTTMPAVVAYSAKGTRIAIAYWNRIFIWPILPKALAPTGIDLEVHEKTYDHNFKCSLVELKSIVLKAEAVVHKMAFTAIEDELVTITDKGLQIWNLGPSATGRRRVGLLFDEKYENIEEGKMVQEEEQ